MYFFKYFAKNRENLFHLFVEFVTIKTVQKTLYVEDSNEILF